MRTLESETQFGQITAARRPLTELFACTPAVQAILSAASQRIECSAGDAVFHQHEVCRGLYVIASGDFVRKAVRMKTHLKLGSVRAGEVVELAAALGDGRHTYTLSALTAGSLLLLPLSALQKAFAIYPPFRMHLLEELAREVSRAYLTCCIGQMSRRRRRGFLTAE
ncbi:MAG TPA: cyclic nucleotide-binding domain-containing protein [Terracidiphilus sp.]|jgi:CRP-like cAMP-binding protein|nr:cyclic nucleotide-binding domain-containing protein [Terracidiphilus sp.]